MASTFKRPCFVRHSVENRWCSPVFMAYVVVDGKHCACSYRILRDTFRAGGMKSYIEELAWTPENSSKPRQSRVVKRRGYVFLVDVYLGHRQDEEEQDAKRPITRCLVVLDDGKGVFSKCLLNG